MISHVIPSLGLALEDVRFLNGKIEQATVVNGGWILVRSGEEWHSKPMHENRIVNRFPIKPEDDVVVEIPEKVGHSYNYAIDWATKRTTKQEKKGLRPSI